jgi:hypothetical protein
MLTMDARIRRVIELTKQGMDWHTAHTQMTREQNIFFSNHESITTAGYEHDGMHEPQATCKNCLMHSITAYALCFNCLLKGLGLKAKEALAPPVP